MEIAALPSCEKSLFAGAKVALFFQKIHPDSRVTDCRVVIISINKEFSFIVILIYLTVKPIFFLKDTVA